MEREDKTIIAYCLYCKNPIYLDEDYVVRNGNKYHVECYELIESDSYGIDLEDYTETDYED